MNGESGCESAIAAVVKITFEESSAGYVIVNSRVLNVQKYFSTAKGL